MRRGFFPCAAAAALGLILLASCERDFQSPFDPNSPDYIGDDWSKDGDGDGVADSVHKYYPSCSLPPRECVAAAKDLSRLAQSVQSFSARNLILWKGGPGASPRVEVTPPELGMNGFTITSSDSQKVLPKDGLLFGLSAGEATLTATLSNLPMTATFTAKVVDQGKPVRSIAAADLTVGVGQDAAPRLTWTPGDAAYREFALTSGNPAVAAVEGGKVKGISVGAAKVTAEALDGGAEASFTVTVTAEKWIPVEGLRADDMNLVAGGDGAAPAISWTPADASDKRYQLVTRDKAVAEVSAEKDRVVPKAPGTAQVVVMTLDGSGKTAQFQVRVSARPVRLTGVAVSDLRLIAGSTAVTPSIAWTPADASNRNYSLASDNPAVASVSGGRILPLAPGEARFVLTAADGGLQAAFRVSVSARDPAIHVDSVAAADMDMAAGTVRTPELTWYPANAADMGYTLISLQPNVAEPVGAAVAAKAPGTAAFRLTTADGGRVALFQVRVFQPDIAVESVRAEPLSLREGDSAVSPILTWNPPNATDKRYSLSSDDPRVAAILADTLVRPAGPGNANVTLRTPGGVTAQFQVAVAIRPVALTAIAIPAFSMKVGDPDKDLEAVYTPPDATDKGFTITGISDPGVVAAAGPARVRAAGPGNAVITVETTGPVKLTAQCTVTVAMPVASLSAGNLTMRKGESVLPTLAWTPADASDKGYSLASDNPAVVAAIGDSLRAVAGGSATVTATSHDGGKTAAFTVTVVVPAVSLSAADLTVSAGAEADPALTWDPPDAGDKGYAMVSENAAVASIDGARVRGVAPGTARIRVTSTDGSLTAAFTVTVPDTAVRVQGLAAADLSIKVGNPDATPTLTWNPPDATDKGYTLVSSQPGVAAVVGDRIHAVAAGTASLQVTAHDGGFAANFTVTVSEDTVRVDSLRAADMNLDSSADQGGRAPVITWYPANAKNKGYSLASADTAVASISGNLVVPVSRGNTYVTVTSDDGGKTATFAVHVKGKGPN